MVLQNFFSINLRRRVLLITYDVYDNFLAFLSVLIILYYFVAGDVFYLMHQTFIYAGNDCVFKHTKFIVMLAAFAGFTSLMLKQPS